MELSAEIIQAVDERFLRSAAAQEKGDTVLVQVLPSIERYVGYRLILFPRLTKSRDRALQKALSLSAKPENAQSTPQVLVAQIRDFCGARVIVVGLSDIHLVQKACLTRFGNFSCWQFGDATRFIENANARGFRGLIQDIEIALDDGIRFPYELQIMTSLQHAWDQLQHKFYELARVPSRSGEEYSSVHQVFMDLSNQLYQLDLKIDDIRRKTIPT